VQYDQAGDANYNAAPQVVEHTVAQKAIQTISVTTHAPSSATYNTSFTVAATGGGSGNPVTFSEGGVCTAAGVTFTMTSGTGTCDVKYDQTGDANYNAATQVVEHVAAQKAGQTITFGPLPVRLFGDPDFTVTATADSGLPVSFAASGQCMVTGVTVHLVASGTCTITASQAGNDNYSTAAPIPQSFTITAWTLKGFYQPADASALNGNTWSIVWNNVKGGSTVPLKFNIYAGPTEQTTTAAVKSIKLLQVSCVAGVADTTVTASELSNTGGTSLRYDGTSAQFIQNWQTPKQPNTCYQVIMTAADSSIINSAFFKLK
jgi:hypothetical protein